MFLKAIKSLIPKSFKKKITPYILTRMPILTRRDLKFRREKKYTFGKLNPDVTFYVIRSTKKEWGLLAVWKYVIVHLKYAEKKGYIPVINAKNYFLPLLQDEQKKYKENAWDYYFVQPYPQWSLDEVYGSKNVILADMDFMHEGNAIAYLDLPMQKKALQEWADLSNKYLRVTPCVQEYAAQIEKSLFPENGRILGVSIRRGFNQMRLTNHPNTNAHPAPPEMETYVADIKKYMREWNCDYFFLSTEDRDACDFFARKFEKKCLLMDRPRYHMFVNGKPRKEEDKETLYMEFHRKNNMYLSAKEYLAEIILLSRCHCLLAGISGGVQTAYIMNNGRYDHIKMY